ncbi:MAG: dienelactone hydrolase family protein [Myxococcaceae bacterium]|nr:dienelactone hydrolase family protein [Myxococcaceae bacterium]
MRPGLLLLVLAGCGPMGTGPPAPLTPGAVFLSRGDPFLPGPLEVTQRDLREGELGAPKPVRVTAPTTPGTYPVVQFQHGFLSDRRTYDEILGHLASHGFVVVAPQLYPADGVPLGKMTALEEAKAAKQVADWAQAFAAAVMGSAADPRPLGVAGHSRGGKVTWLLTAQLGQPARGIVGVDPVDGRGGPLLSAQPEALPGPLDTAPPSLVVGMALGGACAPEGDNFQHFFDRTTPPTRLLLVKNQGHADMLDADVGTAGLCAEGPDRKETRRVTGGALAAFFRWRLQDDEVARSFLDSDLLTTLEVTRAAR